MAFLFAHWLIGQRVPFSINLLLRHLKSVSAFCGMLSICVCVCVWGVFRPVHLPLINWYQKQSALPGITVLFRIRDCDSCIWKRYLECCCYCCCCHQWNMQVFTSPHTTFELWAICSAVPKNVSLLIFGSGFVFCLFVFILSDIKIPIFVVLCLCKFLTKLKKWNLYHNETFLWISLNKTEILLATNTRSHIIIFKLTLILASSNQWLHIWYHREHTE